MAQTFGFMLYVLGLGLGLESQVLGLGLGLVAYVLGLGLGLAICVLDSITVGRTQRRRCYPLHKCTGHMHLFRAIVRKQTNKVLIFLAQ